MSEKLKAKVDLLSSKLKEADEDISNLEKVIYEEQDKNVNLKKTNEDLHNHLNEAEKVCINLKNELNIKDVKIKSLEIKIIEQEADDRSIITKLQNEKILLETNIEKLNFLNKNLENKIIENKINEEKTLLLQEELIIKQYQDQIKKLNLDILNYQNEIFSLKQKIISNSNKCCCIS